MYLSYRLVLKFGNDKGLKHFNDYFLLYDVMVRIAIAVCLTDLAIMK